MNDMEILGAMKDLSDWRINVLKCACYYLCDPKQRELQVRTGIWDISGDLMYPAEEDMTILSNGCLVFSTRIGNDVIHFSVWMTVGEVRIGAKIPFHLLPDDTTERHISSAFDGAPCQRSESIGNGVLFDWIFRDGFASHSYMSSAVFDEDRSGVIATRIGEILVHIYMSLTSYMHHLYLANQSGRD